MHRIVPSLIIFLFTSITAIAEPDVWSTFEQFYNWPVWNQTDVSQNFCLGMGANGNAGSFCSGIGNGVNMNGFGNVYVGLGDTFGSTSQRTLLLGNALTNGGFSFGGAIGDFASMQGNNGFWLGNPGVSSNAFNWFVSSNSYANTNFAYEGVYSNGLTLNGSRITSWPSGGSGGFNGSSVYFTTNVGLVVWPIFTNVTSTNVFVNSGVTNTYGGSPGQINGTNQSASLQNSNLWGAGYDAVITQNGTSSMSPAGVTSFSFNGNGSGLSNITATGVSGWNTNQSFYQLDVVKSYAASGSKIQTTGTWSGSSHSVTVASAATWKTNEGIWLQAAGSPGTNFVTVVTAIAGNVFTLRDATTTGQTTLRVQHDETFAISNAFYDAFTNGGGFVYLPGRNTNGVDGYYRVNAPFNPNGNCILGFPLNTTYSGVPATIYIEGEVRGSSTTSGISGGCTLDALDAQQMSGTFPSVIGSGMNFTVVTQPNYLTSFNCIDPHVDHLLILTQSATSESGINFLNAICGSIGDDVFVYGGGTYPSAASCGIGMPQWKNNTHCRVGQCTVVGYQTGILCAETCDLDRPWIQQCNLGLNVLQGIQPVIGSVNFLQNTHNFWIDGGATQCHLQINAMIENTSTGPYANGDDFHDVNGLIAGGYVHYVEYSDGASAFVPIVTSPSNETNSINLYNDGQAPYLVASQLTGQLPALNASQLTSLNASQLTAGTVPSSALPSTFTYGSPQLGMTNGVNAGIAMGFNTYYTNNYTSHRITETIDLSLTDQISTPVLIGVYPFQANGTPRMPRYVGTPLGVAAATTNSINLNMGVGEWFAITNIAGTASVVTNEVQIW